MAKKKEKMPERQKSELPITKGEFNNVIIVGGLIAVFKKHFEKNSDFSDYHFVPMLYGYQVFFTEKGKSCNIDIKKRKYLGGCRVTKYVDGFKKASCLIKSREENELAVQKLLLNQKVKKSKKKG